MRASRLVIVVAAAVTLQIGFADPGPPPMGDAAAEQGNARGQNAIGSGAERGPKEASAAAPGPPPKNRCKYSRVFLRGAEGDRTRIRGKAAAVDQDYTTAVELPGDGSQALELHFIGAPRWLNQILAVTDASGFDIEIFDLYRVWQPYGSGEAAIEPGTPVRVAGPDVKVRGLRFVPRKELSDGSPVRLFELEAHFEQVDPDDLGRVDDDGNYEYFYEWVNDYPWWASDLSLCDDDAKGLGNQLPGNWSQEGYANDHAWEEDFKRSSKGGKEHWYVDTADLAYFSGHGSSAGGKKTLYFNGRHDDRHLTPGDAKGAWGDDDMEWMCFSACKLLKSKKSWSKALNGAHLILGWKTVMNDSNLGVFFGDAMVSSGAHDPAKTIIASWFYAGDVIHSRRPRRIARAIGENSAMGSDYLWGQGSVNDDPTPNSSYYHWQYRTTNKSRDGDLTTEPKAPPLDPVVFPKKAERGVPVVIDRSLLSGRSDPPQMPTYDVVPPTVDRDYVQAIVYQMCLESELACYAEVTGVCSESNEPCSFPDDCPEGEECVTPVGVDEIVAVDGPLEIRASTNTGAPYIEATDLWMASLTEPPDLLDPGAAAGAAEGLLASWGVLPSDAVLDVGGDELVQGEYELDEDDEVIEETTIATAISVHFRRYLGGYPVEGPGGSMTVAFGDGGEFQRMFSGGWRPVEEGAVVDTVPLGDLLEALSVGGGDATIDGIGPMVEEIQIDDVTLGYYETHSGQTQEIIRPAYTFAVTLTEYAPDEDPPPQSTNQIYMWADTLPPHAQIDFPPNDYSVSPGTEICFQGSASSGVPPYTFEWEDDIDGALGSGPQVCATLSLPSHPDKGTGGAHAVRLLVRDSVGSESRVYATVHVGVGLIPTVSEWGLVVMTLLLLTGAKIKFARRRVGQA